MPQPDERAASLLEACQTEVERRAAARQGQQDLLALQRRTAEALERIANLLATLLGEMRRP